MYECFHCGCRGVIWDADFNAEDYGYMSPGLVQVCHCVECGAEILYVLLDEEEEG